MILKAIKRIVHKRIPLFALVFATIFTCLAVVQFFVLRQKILAATEARLSNWASRGAEWLKYDNGWQISEYRQFAGGLAPASLIFTNQGTIVETRGFISGLIGRVKLIDEDIFESPKIVSGETNEKWMMFGKRLKGGVLVLGVLAIDKLKNPEEFLRKAAVKFGVTLDEALKIGSEKTDQELDYAIIDDTGTLRYAAEALPLKTDPALIEELAKLHGPVQLDGGWYYFYSKSVKDQNHQPVGTIILPYDFTAESQAIQDLKVFNAIASGATFVAVIFILGVYLKLAEWKSRPKAASIEEALANGESQTIELKGGAPNMTLAVAIAAFANTNSGTIFVGINDDCEVVGIDCQSPTRKDAELQRLRNIVSQKISPVVVVHPDFIIHQSKTILRIFVPRGDEPLYYVENVIYVRELTSKPKASPEQVKRILAGFRRWS